jgi:hypothetical protein
MITLSQAIQNENCSGHYFIIGTMVENLKFRLEFSDYNGLRYGKFSVLLVKI